MPNFDSYNRDYILNDYINLIS